MTKRTYSHGREFYVQCLVAEYHRRKCHPATGCNCDQCEEYFASLDIDLLAQIYNDRFEPY